MIKGILATADLRWMLSAYQVQFEERRPVQYVKKSQIFYSFEGNLWAMYAFGSSDHLQCLPNR